jgi:hypothetical protein
MAGGGEAERDRLEAALSRACGWLHQTVVVGTLDNPSQPPPSPVRGFFFGRILSRARNGGRCSVPVGDRYWLFWVVYVVDRAAFLGARDHPNAPAVKREAEEDW